MLDFMNELGDNFLSMLQNVLPLSPFSKYIDEIAQLPYLSYLNWFIPVGEFVAIGTLWLGAISIFYLYQIILRWVKAIE